MNDEKIVNYFIRTDSGLYVKKIRPIGDEITFTDSKFCAMKFFIAGFENEDYSFKNAVNALNKLGLKYKVIEEEEITTLKEREVVIEEVKLDGGKRAYKIKNKNSFKTGEEVVFKENIILHYTLNSPVFVARKGDVGVVASDTDSGVADVLINGRRVVIDAFRVEKIAK